MLKKVLLLSPVLLVLMFFAVTGENPADVSAQLEQAEIYKQDGQYEQAEAIYQQIVTDFPDSNDALEAQKQLTLIYIAWNKWPQADEAFQQLLASFPAHKDIAQAVHDIGYQYRLLQKYEKANQIDQYVVDNWPASDYAVLAQMDLAKYYVDQGNDTAAEAAVDKLFVNFSQNPLIARALHDVGQHYRDLKKYEKANELYQHVIDNWPKTEHALWSQADLIKSNVALGNDAAAQAAINKLVTNFTDNPLTARAVWDTGQLYRGLKKYQKANELYQHVIDNWPKAEHALWSQADLIKSHLALGDDPNAQAAVDKLLVNFTGNPLIARAVWDTARVYRDSKKYEKANQLYQDVIDNWPDSEHALCSQTDMIKLHTTLANDAAAQAAVDKLLTDFSENPLIARTVWDTGQYYRDLKKYEKANALYQHVIDNWPDTAHALWSQADLIKSNVALGDDVAAQAAIDKLLTNFTDNPLTARAVWDTGQYYRGLKKYKKSNELYQHVIDNWPKTEHAMWAEADLIKSYLALGDDPNAQAAVDKLLANFTDNPLIARAVWDTARVYRDSKKYEKANEIYQHVIDNYPKAEHAVLSQIGVAEVNVLSLIESGNEAAAEAALDNLIADFNDHPGLPDAVFQIADKYYNKAIRHTREGRNNQAHDFYLKAIAVWQKMIQELPLSAKYTPRAYYCSAVIYSQELGEYLKGIGYYQIIVDNWPDYKYAWHAQYFIGKYYEKLKESGSLPESEANPKIEEAYKLVIEKYPDSKSTPYAALKLGRLNFKKSEWVDATMYFELFLEKAPEDQRRAGVLYDLGRSYDEMGELDVAVRVYSTFIEIADPDDPRVKGVEARLEELKE